ncbi:MAG: BTAD domain-containing putative transcriptional regulator, partial [Chloroflexota bacterium]
MSELEIRCFNGFEVFVNKQRVERFYSQKTKALLIYLAIESMRLHNRSHLAGILWPTYDEGRARRNLSQTLTSLRKDLGDINQNESFFQISTQSIGLAGSENIYIDTKEFDATLSSIQKHTHQDILTCPACTNQLRQIINLYSGPFLHQFGEIDSVEFENWGLLTRERYLQEAIDAHTQFINNLIAQNQLDEAVTIAKQLLQMAPWRESAHQQLMLLFAKQGHRIQALNQYDQVTEVLMSELGVAPSAETDRLYDQILAGEFSPSEQPLIEKPQERAAPVIETPFQAPSVSPHFVGRTELLETVGQSLLEQPNSSPPVAIVGMGGVGKTAFAAQKARDLKPSFTDGVLWANSMTSQPHNILDSWARAYGHDFSSLTDLDSKATAVRGMLANKRVLLIIDNVENVSDIRPLLPSSESCAVLLTTRNSDVATALNAKIVRLDELTAENGKKLMIRILGQERISNNPDNPLAA